MSTIIHWWQSLSWSGASLVLCLVYLAALIGAMFAGDPTCDTTLRGSRDDQFQNTSRNSYVARRGIRG